METVRDEQFADVRLSMETIRQQLVQAWGEVDRVQARNTELAKEVDRLTAECAIYVQALDGAPS